MSNKNQTSKAVYRFAKGFLEGTKRVYEKKKSPFINAIQYDRSYLSIWVAGLKGGIAGLMNTDKANDSRR